ERPACRREDLQPHRSEAWTSVRGLLHDPPRVRQYRRGVRSALHEPCAQGRAVEAGRQGPRHRRLCWDNGRLRRVHVLIRERRRSSHSRGPSSRTTNTRSKFRPSKAYVRSTANASTRGKTRPSISTSTRYTTTSRADPAKPT